MTTRSSTAMLAAPRVSSLFITNLHLLTVGLRSAYQPDVQRGLAVGTASWYLCNIMCPLQGKLKGDCGVHGHGQGKAPVSKRVAAPLSWPSQLAATWVVRDYRIAGQRRHGRGVSCAGYKAEARGRD